MQMMGKITAICFLGLLAVGYSERILVLGPVGSRSHKFALMPIAKGLAERGHQVTVVTSHEPTEKIENVQEITSVNIFEGKDAYNWFKLVHEGSFQNLFKIWTLFSSYVPTSRRVYENLIADAKFRSIIDNRSVDLVILDDSFNDFCLPIIDHLGAPFVFHSSTTGQPWTWNAMGVSSDSAFIPNRFSPFDDRMSFFQRMRNALMGILFQKIRNWAILTRIEDYIRLDFPNTRPISEIERDAALFLVSSHVTTYWPRSLPPNVVPIGSLHTRPAAPLPQDLERFVEESGENGFVIFSLGSIESSRFMPSVYFNILVQTFSRLGQKVVWKWDAEPPQINAPNILMVKWLPQQDLLGHEKCRLFITHGGLLGMQEAIYHGVPLLGLPFATDQHANVAKAIREGMGLKIDWADLSEDRLGHAIETIINTPSFRGNATRLSKLAKDELLPGRDVAIYWLEHVLRHGGADHLKLASNKMPFYQVYLLDIMAFLLMVSLAFFYVSLVIFRFLKRIVCPKPGQSFMNKSAGSKIKQK